MSAPHNDQHGRGEEMISNTKECTSCEQNKNSVDDITKGMDSMATLKDISTCASCGKEGSSDDMNTCNKCKSVKYCNAACKKKHRKKHKKACERRVAELHDEQLFKDHPPREECPLCMLPLPLDAGESAFQSCCGKTICNGCVYGMVKSEGGARLCPYCRTPTTKDNEELLKQGKKLMDKGNAYAYYMHAANYAQGIMGMPVDLEKSNQLLLKAGELGCAVAYYNLGNSYMLGEGVEVDLKKAKHYWELAAMMGHVEAQCNVGYAEGQAGNHHRALKHFIIAAKAGSNTALGNVKTGFKKGMITKDEYEVILRAHQMCIDGMKSESRDKVAAIIGNARM